MKPFGFFWVWIFSPIRSSRLLEIRTTPAPAPPPPSLLGSRHGYYFDFQNNFRLFKRFWVTMPKAQTVQPGEKSYSWYDWFSSRDSLKNRRNYLRFFRQTGSAKGESRARVNIVFPLALDLRFALVSYFPPFSWKAHKNAAVLQATVQNPLWP